MVESIYFLKPAWCGTPCAGLWPEQGLQPVRKAFAFRRRFFTLREKHRPGEGVEQRSVMEFFETDEFGGQTDNWVAPSLTCLQAFCRTAGFARVVLEKALEQTACLTCYRHWEPPSPDAPDGPELTGALHINGGVNFDSSRDEMVSAWFRWKADGLNLDDVRPEVGGYGVRPIHVAHVGPDDWQTNFKLPPGLTRGWQEVRMRIGPSRPGSAQRIAVDIPLGAREIRIEGVRDGTTWEENQLDLSRGQVLAIWASGLPENVDLVNLSVTLDGRRSTVIHIQSGEGARQINVMMPPDFKGGSAEILLSIGDFASARATVYLTFES